MKRLIQKILRDLAKIVLWKYKPTIVGITGSVGKSSTKEAVYAVLKDQFNVRRSLKNYNNELGLPLTVFSAIAPGKSLAGWLKVFWKALGLILFPDRNYPKVLVLEMAADHPGDIGYLTSLARPSIGVVTSVSSVHLEFFKNLDNVAKEKSGIITGLPINGWAILNEDDERVREMRKKVKAKVLTFGFAKSADVRAEEIFIDQSFTGQGRLQIKGLNFKLSYAGTIMPAFLPGVLAKYHIYGALAAAAVGSALGMNLVDISEGLRDYQPSPGRMRLIQGIKFSSIIDDTYNSSPEAAKKALETLKEISPRPHSNVRLSIEKGQKAKPLRSQTIFREKLTSEWGRGKLPVGRRWAVLGDMLELGRFTEPGHLEVGYKAAELGIDYLVTVGQRAKIIARGAKERGLNEDKIFSFDDTESAGKFLQEKIVKGDLILVKGSQGVRMEKIVKEIMARPLKAKKLLIRQDELWI